MQQLQKTLGILKECIQLKIDAPKCQENCILLEEQLEVL